MRYDHQTALHLVQRLPHAASPWPTVLACAPCALAQQADGVWVGWWSPDQRLIIGALSVGIGTSGDVRLIDVSSRYALTWFDAGTPSAAAVQAAIPGVTGPGVIARSLLGPHHVAFFNTGAAHGLMSLAPETHAVRARLRQIVEYGPADGVAR